MLYIGTFAVVSLMVGDATNRYIDDNPSLCEVVKYINDTDENGTNGTGQLIPLVTELDLIDCPKALEVAIAITFITGLIMVRVEQCVCVCVCVRVCACDTHSLSVGCFHAKSIHFESYIFTSVAV